MFKILAINPGATSTKIGMFHDDKPVFADIIRHEGNEIARFNRSVDQYQYRKKVLLEALNSRKIDLKEISAVIGRGGPFKPLVGGVYEVNDAMINDVMNGNVQAEHVSLIGCLLAREIAALAGCPAFIADPVSVDEFEDQARISGFPDLPRKSLSHALNMKMVGRKAAAELGKKYDEVNLVIAHLGGGISVSPHKKGRIIDANNANDGGPMSPQRSGYLPVTGLVKMCFSGKHNEKQIMDMILKNGGLKAHLGTDDLREVLKMIEGGDSRAELIFMSLVYQISKEIGAMSAALKGEVDAIVLTGGMAYQKELTEKIVEYVSWIAPVMTFPGEDELEALNLAALMALKKETEPAKYA
ncbi:butyrate kinase [candidate division WOR-3 bacterium]|nr:butyrate kinase [candidate division WOR-3 bacterium]